MLILVKNAVQIYGFELWHWKYLFATKKHLTTAFASTQLTVGHNIFLIKLYKLQEVFCFILVKLMIKNISLTILCFIYPLSCSHPWFIKKNAILTGAYHWSKNVSDRRTNTQKDTAIKVFRWKIFIDKVIRSNRSYLKSASNYLQFNVRLV